MSFWRTYYHLIWATKQRQPMITPAVEAQLYPYLVRKAAEAGITVYAVNGWTDHIHLVVSIPPRLSVAEAVKEFKGASSRYINAQAQSLLPSAVHFAWQEGYGVLTISERHCHIAIEYVQRQKEHHAANHTNARLEHCDEDDAGPNAPNGYIASPPAHERLREESAPYVTTHDPDDDLPF